MTATLASDLEARPGKLGEIPLFRRARTWWLILALLLIAGQNSLFTEGVKQSKQLEDLHHTYDTSSPILQLMTLVTYALCVGLLFGHWGTTLRALIRQKTFLCFFMLASMSVFWSQDPVGTFRQLPRLFLMIVLGWSIGLLYTTEEQIRITLTTGFILVSTSVIFAVALPRYGLDADGEWKGIMGQKNQLGHATLFLFSGLLFRTVHRNRVFWTLAGLLATLVLFKTRSAESLMLAILLVAIRFYGPLILRTRKEKRPFHIFTIAAGLLAVIVGRVFVLDLFGKDTTLTGRTVEWATLWPFAMQHFWLGYGYRAFWTGTGDSLQAMKLVGGSMHGSDSGYLDLLLQFGIVGLTLAVTIMVSAGFKSIRLFSAGRLTLPAYWYFGLVVISFVGNFADAYFPLTGGAPEVMLIFACAGLEQLSNAVREESRLARDRRLSLQMARAAS